MDRLVAFFALYTRQGSLADILRSLTVEVVKSKLGAREVTLTFSAESSDRMDRIAEVARLSGGYTFTGTSRHFVQYRDAAAPFGYDIGQITPSDAALALYHNAFSQTYDVERKIEVEWARSAEDSFPVRVIVHTDDRPGMLNQLTSVLYAENTNIRSLEAKTETDHDGGVVEMTVDVRDKKQLEKLVTAMRRISGVRDVERLFK